MRWRLPRVEGRATPVPPPDMARRLAASRDGLPVEALRVGHGEVLIVRLPESFEQHEALCDTLATVGLSGRAVVIQSDGVQLAVVKRNGWQAHA